jgi:hypothetical protein
MLKYLLRYRSSFSFRHASAIRECPTVLHIQASKASFLTSSVCVQTSYYLGYSALLDHFPSSLMKPNPECANPHCRARQVGTHNCIVYRL